MPGLKVGRRTKPRCQVNAPAIVRNLPLGEVLWNNAQDARRCAFRTSWEACRHHDTARRCFTLVDKLLGSGQLHISAGKSLHYMLSEIRGIGTDARETAGAPGMLPRQSQKVQPWGLRDATLMSRITTLIKYRLLDPGEICPESDAPDNTA